MRLKDVREPARVRRLLGNDHIEVEAGFMKMQVSMDDVIEVLPETGGTGSKLPKGVSYKPAPELAPVHQEINVIGQRAEEARDAVDEFLDHAVMATASRIRIVHGHGMGILKKTIAELLARHPHVSKFYQAPQQEGGAGATIVEYRESKKEPTANEHECTQIKWGSVVLLPLSGSSTLMCVHSCSIMIDPSGPGARRSRAQQEVRHQSSTGAYHQKG